MWRNRVRGWGNLGDPVPRTVVQVYQYTVSVFSTNYANVPLQPVHSVHNNTSVSLQPVYSVQKYTNVSLQPVYSVQKYTNVLLQSFYSVCSYTIQVYSEKIMPPCTHGKLKYFEVNIL